MTGSGLAEPNDKRRNFFLPASVPAMMDNLTQGTRLGACELLVRIGRGGMATVWVARQHGATPDEDRLVAIKVMLAELAEDPAFVRMFRDEVTLIEAIDHPNVVEVYDVGLHQDAMYMVMEWVEGESLHSLMAEAGKRAPIPSEIAVRIIADAAAGLHAAHELRGSDGQPLGVVHRDVSPQNILIGTDGRVKLVDFGVAKAVGRLSESTRAGQLKGKFGYMAPEQVRGSDVDRRADVFALGIVLYELTTNQRLFRGETDIATLKKVLAGVVPPPSSAAPGYSPALERIVLRALHRDASARFQTAAELETALREHLREERIVVPRSGIARLLKKVMATRIEQRRRALRKALHSLDSTDGIELLSDEPAFTPTGAQSRRIRTGVSVVTGVSLVTAGEVSIIDADSKLLAPGWRGAVQRHLRRLEKKVGGRAPLIAYVVGASSLLLGLVLTASALLRPGAEEPAPGSAESSEPPRSINGNAPRQISGATPDKETVEAPERPPEDHRPQDKSRPVTLEELDE